MSTEAAVLAVDLGGTKTAVSLARGRTTARKTVRFPTPRTATETLVLLERHASNLLEGSRAAAVGVSFGGHVNAGRVRSLHVAGWESIDLASALTPLTTGAVGIINDAEAGALAEYAARRRRPDPPSSLLYVTVSTGIGGAFVSDGEVLRGARGLAGELGHLPLGGAAPCSCSGNGHLEAHAAGPAIARAARAGLNDPRFAESLLHGERPLDARAVALAAERGDSLAREVLQSAGVRLGTGLAMGAMCLDPAVICLGGGVAQAGPALWDPMREALARHPLARDVPVEPSVHGSDSALEGAVIHGAGLVYADVAS